VILHIALTSFQILHILTAAPELAQLAIRCGLHAGFRESGAINVAASPAEAAMPLVAIRSQGLAFDSMVGIQELGQRRSLVSPEYQDHILAIANERFDENTKRIERFRRAFLEAVSGPNKGRKDGEWEDDAVRRERKRAEGLERSAKLKAALIATDAGVEELEPGLNLIEGP
jgi:tRNA wybutosine-synthesizing protein 3